MREIGWQSVPVIIVTMMKYTGRTEFTFPLFRLVVRPARIALRWLSLLRNQLGRNVKVKSERNVKSAFVSKSKEFTTTAD